METEKRIIKKYPNRRLYDTAISGYITIADVKQMIIEYADIKVVDAKSGEDLTRQVFLQILLEEEAGGTPILSNEMLCQMIRMYGEASHSVFSPFLEQNMKIFAEWQDNLQEQAKAMGKANKWLTDPFRQNLSSNKLPFLEWQKSLQQQALRFWQDVGMVPKEKK